MLKRIKKYKSISLFTFSSVFLNISSLIAGLVTYRFIEPYYIGIWQSLMLIDSYSIFFRLGIINGMNRELPYAMGQGNESLAVKYAETTLYFTLVTIITFFVLAFGSLFFIHIEQDWIFPLTVILLIVPINFYSSFLMGTFRANADFDRLSRIQIIQGVLKFVSIILVVKWGFKGFALREISIVSLITFLAYRIRPLKKVKPNFDRAIFTKLFKVGFPIFVTSYIIIFLNTAPRLILLKYGSVSMLGIYAPLLTIITAISVIPDSIANYFYPKMTHQIGKTNDRLAIWKKSLYSHIGLIILGIPVVIGCLLFIPYLIDTFIPKYVESKSIIGIGVFTALFMSYKFGYTTLITLKEWKLIVVYIAFFAILQFILPLILLNYTSVLLAVVIGQLVSATFMVVVSLSTNYIATHRKNTLINTI